MNGAIQPLPHKPSLRARRQFYMTDVSIMEVDVKIGHQYIKNMFEEHGKINHFIWLYFTPVSRWKLL